MQCRNCFSFKVNATIPRNIAKTPIGLLGGFIGSLGCLGMLVGVLFFPLLPVAFLIFIIGSTILWLPAKLKGQKAFKCRACGAYWEV